MTTSSSWAPVDLTAYLDGSYRPPTAGLMFRDDEQGLLYPAQIHFLAGESGSGKGWLVNHAAAGVLNDGGSVLFLDFEDAAGPVVSRLLAVEVEPTTIASRFRYIRPFEPHDDAADEHLDEVIEALAPSLIVVDGVTEAMSLQNLNPNANDDTARWLAQLARPLADTGAAVVLIDHTTKSNEHGKRFAIGAQHKRAGSAVTYAVETKKPIEMGRDDGLVKLWLAKDRHGTVQTAAHGDTMPKLVAEFHVSANLDGTKVSARLSAPAEPGTWRPTTLMEKVSRHLETYPGLSLRQLRTDVGGKAEFVGRAVDLLLAEKYVHIEPHGQTHRHYSTRPYRADTDPLSDTFQKSKGGTQ